MPPCRPSAASVVAVAALLALAALAVPAAAAPANLTAKAKAGSTAQPKLTAKEEAHMMTRALALLNSTEAKSGSKAANQAGSANYAPLNTAGRYVPTQLVSYKRYRGQSQWDASSQRRVLKSLMTLFTNGYYRYDVPDSWYRSLTGPTSARSDGRYFRGFQSYRWAAPLAALDSFGVASLVWCG